MCHLVEMYIGVSSGGRYVSVLPGVDVTWWRCPLVCHQRGGMSVCYLVLMLPGGDVHWRVISGGGMSGCYLVDMYIGVSSSGGRYVGVLPGGDILWCVIIWGRYVNVLPGGDIH